MKTHSHNALILLWTGRQITDRAMEEIVTVLANHRIAIPELVTAVYKDEQAIANSVIRDSDGTTHMDVTIQQENADKAFRTAIVYIGERYKNLLMSANGNYASFAFKLTTDMNSAFINGNDIELKNACEIIANARVIVSSKFMKENHFSENAVNVIRQVYNHFAV